jgi:hypothetical protein
VLQQRLEDQDGGGRLVGKGHAVTIHFLRKLRQGASHPIYMPLR